MTAVVAEYLRVTPGPAAKPGVPRAPTAPSPSGMLVLRVVKMLVFWLVAFLAVGNLVILAGSAWAKAGLAGGQDVSGVNNFSAVDARLWRGAAPTDEGYAALAERGVATIIDLRAEHDVEDRSEMLAAMGVRWVHIPFRDGQTPTEDQVQRFLAAMKESDGPAFVHCGAGVGRTGAMVAAYLASTGQASGAERVFDNLAVGPPSLEQIVYAAGIDGGDYERPNVAIVAASRLLDAPRRILHTLGI